MTDAELINAFRAGDEAAFEELLFRYRGMTRKVAGQFFATGWAYSDLLLEAEIGVWEAAIAWSGEGLFSSWANLVAVRKVISLIKCSTRQKALPLRNHIDMDSSAIFSAIEAGSIGGIADDPLDVLIEKEDHLESALRLSKLMDCMTSLESAILRERLAGKSYREIALKMSTTVRGVDNALQRARKKLINAHS